MSEETREAQRELGLVWGSVVRDVVVEKPTGRSTSSRRHRTTLGVMVHPRGSSFASFFFYIKGFMSFYFYFMFHYLPLFLLDLLSLLLLHLFTSVFISPFSGFVLDSREGV